MSELAIVADDLSGAVESAASAILRTTRIEVELVSAHGTPATAGAGATTSPRVTCFDTDSRHASSATARHRLEAIAKRVTAAGITVQKVDSLLRGNIAVEVDALASALGRPAVVAPALPELGRTVSDGVLLVDGCPLADTDLWSGEDGSAPASTQELLGVERSRLVPLALVSTGGDALVAALRNAHEAGRVPICDAVTVDHLRHVRDAAFVAWQNPLLVGSAAMVGVVTELLDDDDGRSGDGVRNACVEDDSDITEPAPGTTDTLWLVDRLLVVLGTASTATRAQLRHLEPLADVVVRLHPELLLSDPATARRQLNEVGRARLGVVTVDQRTTFRPEASARLATALGAVVADAVTASPAVFLSGGETARRVLDRVGIRSLRPVRILGAGTVLSTTSTGQLVITRPGSFGDARSLVTTARALVAGLTSSHKEPT